MWCTTAIGIVFWGLLTTLKTTAMTAWHRAASTSPTNLLHHSSATSDPSSPSSYINSNEYHRDSEVSLVMSKLDDILLRSTHKDENDDVDIKVNENISSSTNITPTDIHVVVLVHGILGNAMELDYLKVALEREAEDFIRVTSDIETCSASSSTKVSPVLVYRVHSNVGKTLDGIAAGGTRIAEEINHLVQKLHERFQHDNGNGNTDHPIPKVKISFVGHSLGGLYSRYAISKIRWKTTTKTSGSNSQNNSNEDKSVSIGAYPKVFCTTASPHLGLHQQSSIPVPRFVEQSIGLTLQESGRDLFRMTPLLNQMAMDPMFVQPLLDFENRLTYVNAYGTDFQVPAVTAAFVVDDEESIKHKRIFNDDDEDFVVLRLQTQQQEVTLKSSMDTSSVGADDGEQESLLGDPLSISNAMLARHLDSMGWTKVWIDVRSLIPSLNPLSSSSSISSEETQQERDVQSIFGRAARNSEGNEDAAPDHLVTSKDVYQSEISQRFDITRFPIGHTVMVANSKSETYANLNAGGRPIMDRLAKDMIKSIFR